MRFGRGLFLFLRPSLCDGVSLMSCQASPVVRGTQTEYVLFSRSRRLIRLSARTPSWPPWVTLGRPPCRLTRPLALPAGPLRVLSVSASSVGDPEIFESALTPTGMHGRSECRHRWEDTGYTYVVRTYGEGAADLHLIALSNGYSTSRVQHKPLNG